MEPTTEPTTAELRLAELEELLGREKELEAELAAVREELLPAAMAQALQAGAKKGAIRQLLGGVTRQAFNQRFGPRLVELLGERYNAMR